MVIITDFNSRMVYFRNQKHSQRSGWRGISFSLRCSFLSESWSSCESEHSSFEGRFLIVCQKWMTFLCYFYEFLVFMMRFWLLVASSFDLWNFPFGFRNPWMSFWSAPVGSKSERWLSVAAWRFEFARVVPRFLRSAESCSLRYRQLGCWSYYKTFYYNFGIQIYYEATSIYNL